MIVTLIADIRDWEISDIKVADNKDTDNNFGLSGTKVADNSDPGNSYKDIKIAKISHV